MHSEKNDRGRSQARWPVLVAFSALFGTFTFYLGWVLASRLGGTASLQTSPVVSQPPSDHHEASHVPLGCSPKARVHEKTQEFVKCMLSPQFTVAGTAGGCELLASVDGKPRTALIEADQLTIDFSMCMPLLTEVWSLDEHLHTPAPAVETARMQRVRLRPNTDDADVVIQTFCSPRFSFLPLVARYVRADRAVSVLDAGASIGLGTFLFAALTRFQGDVLALEPVPSSFEAAENNLKNVRSVVQLLTSALGLNMDVKKATLSGDPARLASFRLIGDDEEVGDGEESYEASVSKLFTLQGRTRAAKFDFIKLDLEGAEAAEFAKPLSREILCEASCIMVDVHEGAGRGADAGGAVTAFANASGCRAGRSFRELPTESDYRVLCRTDLVDASEEELLAPEVEPPPETSLQAARTLFLSGGFPELPEYRAPWGQAWRNSVAMCLTMRQENVTDVREWLIYHRWLGVEHVYLWDNAQAGEQPIGAGLQDFVDEGFLTYTHEPASGLMLLARYRCVEMGRARFDWMGFPDMDEFFILRHPTQKLPALLDEFRDHAGLSVHWVTVGSGGRERRPASGGVLRHYDHCVLNPKGQVKLIANLYFLRSPGCTAHSMQFWGEAAPVNEAHIPIGYESRTCVIKEADGRNPDEYMACNMCPGSRPDFSRGWAPSVKRIGLWHFVIRSREDFDIKSARAQPGLLGKSKAAGYYAMMERKTNFTGPLCDIPAERARQCCPESEYVPLAQQKD